MRGSVCLALLPDTLVGVGWRPYFNRTEFLEENSGKSGYSNLA
jgi:hypothetical protein